MSIVVDGLRTIAREADRLGVRIGLEPYQRDGGELWTIVSSIPEAVALIEDAGDPPALGIQFDVWHLWNTPTLYEDIAARGRPLRRRAHLRLPGPDARLGRPRAAGRRLRRTSPRSCARSTRAGWDGLYDIEIFSDDGTFGNAYPDSFWAAPAEEALARAREAFERCWSMHLTPQGVEETT